MAKRQFQLSKQEVEQFEQAEAQRRDVRSTGSFSVFSNDKRALWAWKRRNVVNFTRRYERNLDLCEAGQITFAEFDASVQGWINHVRYADTWGLREPSFSTHLMRPPTNR